MLPFDLPNVKADITTAYDHCSRNQLIKKLIELSAFEAFNQPTLENCLVELSGKLVIAGRSAFAADMVLGNINSVWSHTGSIPAQVASPERTSDLFLESTAGLKEAVGSLGTFHRHLDCMVNNL